MPAPSALENRSLALQRGIVASTDGRVRVLATSAVPLKEWETFFVIVGSAAAVFTGLMFVVIALQQESRGANVRHAVRAFASPTVVHFTTVLLLSAILNFPGHSRSSVGLTLLIGATALLGYVVWASRRAREQDAYAPDLGDWIWHYCLPAAAYLSIEVAGATTWNDPDIALKILAGGILLLLVIGIHNTWDSAIWIVINRSSPTDG